jgi:hypothetical protein
MKIKDLKPNMKLQLSVGIPPTLLKLHVSRSGKSIVCDTPVWTPRRLSLTNLNEGTKLTIEQMEKEV